MIWTNNKNHTLGEVKYFFISKQQNEQVGRQQRQRFLVRLCGGDRLVSDWDELHHQEMQGYPGDPLQRLWTWLI